MAAIHEAMAPHLAVAHAKVREDETGSVVVATDDASLYGVIAEEDRPRANVGVLEGTENVLLTVQGLYELAACCVAVADRLKDREG